MQDGTTRASFPTASAGVSPILMLLRLLRLGCLALLASDVYFFSGSFKSLKTKQLLSTNDRPGISRPFNEQRDSP